MIASIDPHTTPPDYPHELEQDLVLANGALAHVRPVVPGDAAVLAEEILTADSETIYLRFFTTDVRPDDAMLETLTVMDYHTRLAVGLIADTGVPVGIARYAAVDDTAVEVAVSVKTGWRRLGIASQLLEIVERAAAERGFTRADALYLSHNKPAESLFAARGYVVDNIESGITHSSLDLKAVGRSV